MGGETASVCNDWTEEEIDEVYNLSFYELMYRASTVHCMYWKPI